MARGPKSSDPTTLTKAEFARRLGISAGRVSQYVTAGMPLERGRVRVEAAAGWIRANVAFEGAGLPTSGEPVAIDGDASDLTAARIAKTNEEIRLLKLQIAEKERRLVDRDEVKRALVSFARINKSAIMNFPARYSGEIAAASGADPKTLAIALDHAILKLLHEIADAPKTGALAG